MFQLPYQNIHFIFFIYSSKHKYPLFLFIYLTIKNPIINFIFLIITCQISFLNLNVLNHKLSILIHPIIILISHNPFKINYLNIYSSNSLFLSFYLQQYYSISIFLDLTFESLNLYLIIIININISMFPKTFFQLRIQSLNHLIQDYFFNIMLHHFDIILFDCINHLFQYSFNIIFILNLFLIKFYHLLIKKLDVIVIVINL